MQCIHDGDNHDDANSSNDENSNNGSDYGGGSIGEFKEGLLKHQPSNDDFQNEEDRQIQETVVHPNNKIRFSHVFFSLLLIFDTFLIAYAFYEKIT